MKDKIQNCIKNAGAIAAIAQNMEECERIKTEEAQAFYTLADKIQEELLYIMKELKTNSDNN